MALRIEVFDAFSMLQIPSQPMGPIAPTRFHYNYNVFHEITYRTMNLTKLAQ
jgi:hypothetical protein